MDVHFCTFARHTGFLRKWIFLTSAHTGLADVNTAILCGLADLNTAKTKVLRSLIQRKNAFADLNTTKTGFADLNTAKD